MALGGTPWLPIIYMILLPIFVFASSSGASDSDFLLKFKQSLGNPNAALSSWNASISPCSADKANWVGVLCAAGKIWGLKLENMGLSGVIDVDSLQQLPYLRTLSFMNNEFDSTWPQINKLTALKSLYLSKNKFHGEIPAQTFQRMQWLKKLHLSNNQFTGAIPTSLAVLPRLKELRLEGNQFVGPIPHFQQNTLVSFNVANNQLQGRIPGILSEMPTSSFSGNEGLCGTPLEECGSKKPSVVSIVVVVIVVAAALVVIGIVIFMLHRRRKNPTMSAKNPPSSIQKKEVIREADDVSHHSTSSHASTHSRRDHMKLTFVRDDRERFDLQELLRASAEILGSGCFSSSYKAALSNGQLIVVKRFKQMNNVGREEFQQHMRRIGRLQHPNLLPLVAYYYRKEEKLLVTDYVKNGSLAVRLHGHQTLGQPSLDWPTRLKIVKGIASGLEYLYKELPSLIAPHGHLKSSNVLLDQSFEPLLNDYGLVPVINQELAQDIMVIYKSPEHIQHGRITKKTDVWSLGILILEILTGKFPANFLQQGKGSDLDWTNWVHSVVPEEWTSEVFDKEMGVTNNTEEEMTKLLKIALACCEVDVDKRWDLEEAIEKIQQVKEKDHDDGTHT